MSRWDPNSRGRLEQAAYDLFLERGYEQTTVSDIAARAGLTERTFFRHYADKREVFFSGTTALVSAIRQALEGVPAGAPAIEAARIAVEAMTTILEGRRVLARERQRIVTAHADLQERALIKRAALTETLAAALLERGVPQAQAMLVADIGMAVFHVGFERWLEDPAERTFLAVVREGFDQLKAVAGGV
jgi:AcrR family transcriptional regulator